MDGIDNRILVMVEESLECRFDAKPYAYILDFQQSRHLAADDAAP